MDRLSPPLQYGKGVLLSCRFYGVMAVYATPDLVFGSVISGFFYSFWNLFAGFLIGVNVSSTFSCPVRPAHLCAVLDMLWGQH